MSGTDLVGMLEQINASASTMDDRIQEEVAAYVDKHPAQVGSQLAESGEARIPTFAGEYVFTEADLRSIAGAEYAQAEADLQPVG
jgi:hypothetical protein